MSEGKNLVVIGFGPIGAALFLGEAYWSGKYAHLTVSEVDEATVQAIKNNGGVYTINTATLQGRSSRVVENVSILNPRNPNEYSGLVHAISQADEIVTCLPNVLLYTTIKDMLVKGLVRNERNVAIYTAENHENPAHFLEELLAPDLPRADQVAFVNTVIGKMSQRIDDENLIRDMDLKRIAPGLGSFLVEEDEHILLAHSALPSRFGAGLVKFSEKQDLVPYKKLKLCGHNMAHATMSYLLRMTGAKYMQRESTPINEQIMEVVWAAFMETGQALFLPYGDMSDDIFREPAYSRHARNLMDRMTNPFLNDSADRGARNPERKLALNDRFMMPIELCLEYGINPLCIIAGAAAALSYANVQPGAAEKYLKTIWGSKGENPRHAEIAWQIANAEVCLLNWLTMPNKPNLINYLTPRLRNS